MKRVNWLAFFGSMAALSCGGARDASSPANMALPSDAEARVMRLAAPKTDVPPTDTSPPAYALAEHEEEGHQLVVGAIACWLGGVWSDAKGATDEQRAADAEKRCHDFVIRIHGADDKGRYERLRAVEAGEVADVKQKILAVSRQDPKDSGRLEELGKLFDGAAAAQRETMSARRAGDRIKKDIAGERESNKLTDDEVAGAMTLSESKAFDALLNLDIGDLTHESRATAILCAMDRMATARGLPKHFKVYVLENPYRQLFGVLPPADVPRDTKKPLQGGLWLSYLTSVANAAGHPVPDRAKSLADRELLAWGGAAAGLGDKLRLEIYDMSNATLLKPVSTAVVRRLDIEYRASQDAVLKAPEPAGPPRHLGHPRH